MSFGFLGGLFAPLFKNYLLQRLQLPSTDLAKIAADSAQYTADQQPCTVDQVQAIDKAIVDDLLGRLIAQAVPKGLSTDAHAAVTATLGALGLPTKAVEPPVG